MADTKISALPATTTLGDLDEFVLNSSGVNEKITGANLKLSVRVAPGQQVSQSNALWLPTSAILESMPRFQTPLTAQNLLTTGTIRVFPIGILRKGHTATGLGWITAAAAVGITNSWAGICTTDRVVRAVSADSAAATGANGPRTFSFGASYVAPDDVFIQGFIMYNATTPPTIYGVTPTIQATPILSGSANTGQTTPVTVGSTLTAVTTVAHCPYVWLTGTA